MEIQTRRVELLVGTYTLACIVAAGAVLASSTISGLIAASGVVSALVLAAISLALPALPVRSYASGVAIRIASLTTSMLAGFLLFSQLGDKLSGLGGLIEGIAVFAFLTFAVFAFVWQFLLLLSVQPVRPSKDTIGFWWLLLGVVLASILTAGIDHAATSFAIKHVTVGNSSFALINYVLLGLGVLALYGYRLIKDAGDSGFLKALWLTPLWISSSLLLLSSARISSGSLISNVLLSLTKHVTKLVHVQHDAGVAAVIKHVTHVNVTYGIVNIVVLGLVGMFVAAQLEDAEQTKAHN